MRRLFALLLLLASVVAPSSFAAEAKSVAADPALEKRVTELTLQLRCLVCQNQTIADSHAELAIDLKNEVREKLARGETDQQVIDFMVQRYGDFVLYRPPLKSTTWLLWFGPFLLLACGLGFLIWKLKSRDLGQENLAPADQQRAAELLGASTEIKENS